MQFWPCFRLSPGSTVVQRDRRLHAHLANMVGGYPDADQSASARSLSVLRRVPGGWRRVDADEGARRGARREDCAVHAGVRAGASRPGTRASGGREERAGAAAPKERVGKMTG